MFYLSSSHICKHLFASFYYLIEEKKVKVSNIYIYEDAFYLLDLIKYLLGINKNININIDNCFIFDYQTIPTSKKIKINYLNEFLIGTKDIKIKSLNLMIKFFIKEFKGIKYILNYYSINRVMKVKEINIIQSQFE